MARKTRAIPTPYATGDAAAAAGMRLVAGSELAKDLDTIENETRDIVANYAKRTGPLIDIWVQPTEPPHKAGRVWIKTS